MCMGYLMLRMPGMVGQTRRTVIVRENWVGGEIRGFETYLDLANATGITRFTKPVGLLWLIPRRV